MSRTKSFEINEYREKILREVRSENNNSFLHDNCKFIEFLSNSNGRGRKKRPHAREVSLFIMNGSAYPIVDGEIRAKKRGGIAPDVMANEMLFNLPEDERTTEKLLELVRREKYL